MVQINNLELTLAVLKPHILKNTYAVDKLLEIIKKNFKIIKTKELVFNTEITELFYKEHRTKFFYNRLSTFIRR